MPSADRSEDVMDMDEELFRAWQSGDQSARDEVWRRVWSQLYSSAYAFGLSMGLDPADAKGAALDACNDGWADIDRQIRNGLAWTGPVNFIGLMGAHVHRRAQDAIRRHRRWTGRIRDLLGDTEEERTASFDRVVGAQQPNQLVAAQTREAVEEIVTTLATWKEICHDRPALADYLDAQLEYVRHCVARSLSELPPGLDPQTMTLDQLLPHLDRDRLEANWDEMNQFVIDRLHITRNTLYTRRSQIRARLISSGLSDSPPFAL